jgi:hypothetical protein
MVAAAAGLAAPESGAAMAAAAAGKGTPGAAALPAAHGFDPTGKKGSRLTSKQRPTLEEERAKASTDLVSAAEGGSGRRRSSRRWWQLPSDRHGRESFFSEPSRVEIARCTYFKPYDPWRSPGEGGGTGARYHTVS